MFNKLTNAQKAELKKLRDNKEYWEAMKLSWSYLSKVQKIMRGSFIVLIVLLGIISNVVDPEAVDTSNIKIVASLDAQQFANEYSANEVSADNQYRDQWVELTGYVHAVRKDVMDKVYVALYYNNGFDVLCYFSNLEELESLSPGQRVKVIGLCKGKNGVSPVLKNCVIR
jgi:hypothetical protein